jgi:hypothetical protein
MQAVLQKDLLRIYTHAYYSVFFDRRQRCFLKCRNMEKGKQEPSAAGLVVPLLMALLAAADPSFASLSRGQMFLLGLALWGLSHVLSLVLVPRIIAQLQRGKPEGYEVVAEEEGRYYVLKGQRQFRDQKRLAAGLGLACMVLMAFFVLGRNIWTAVLFMGLYFLLFLLAEGLKLREKARFYREFSASML